MTDVNTQAAATTETLSQADIEGMEALDLLGLGWNDVPDAPDFINPLTGTYLTTMKLKLETKTPQGKEAYELLVVTHTVVSVLECDSEEAIKNEAGEEVIKAAKPGDKFGIRYMGRTGIQRFMNHYKPAGQSTGLQPLEFIEQCQEEALEGVAVQLKSRISGKYTNTDVIEVSMA